MHLVLDIIALMRSPGIIIRADLEEAQAQCTWHPDWVSLSESKRHQLARTWTQQFAGFIPWSAKPEVHRHFPIDFRRMVMSVFILHRRQHQLAHASSSSSEAHTLSDSNPSNARNCLARLPQVLVNVIVGFIAPVISIPLWELTGAQLHSLCSKSTFT
jgi:hypothetical protein